MVLREFIYNFDFFAAVPSFRVKGEAEVLSICGGIVSMILIGFFLYVFLEDALKIVNFQKI